MIYFSDFEAAGGAFPSFTAAGSFVTNNGTATTPVDIPYPAGVAAGRIAFLHAISRENSTTAHVIDTPSGWNAVGESAIDGLARHRHALFWKRLAGSESGSVGITRTPGFGTADQFGGIISIWQGCITTGTPYEGLNTISTAATSMTAADVTTTGPSRLAIDFMGRLDGTRTATAPSGRLIKYEELNGSDVGVMAAAREQASATTISGENYTMSGAPASRSYHVFGLALIPT